ncbi:hypothetical protein Taro_045995 [Colocasia esculenta]|uniref:Uncharacterized protein n=1 Tax=Colocasia esculenta TaxID=4460 RepID=A0A843WR18_COLES|nr:hypothetical protein [Colocasia esculenta]
MLRVWLLVRSCCDWVHPQPARPCGCVVKADRACVCCGLHQCKVVVCRTGRRCPCLAGSPLVVGVALWAEVSWLRWWDFVCPMNHEVGFVSCAMWALPDGGLVSAMGVWLVVLLWKCQSRLVVFPCVRKRFVVRVSFPCFPLVARGGGAGRVVGAVSRTVATFVVKVPPLVLS